MKLKTSKYLRPSLLVKFNFCTF